MWIATGSLKGNAIAIWSIKCLECRRPARLS
jgi:hypothetical protein